MTRVCLHNGGHLFGLHLHTSIPAGILYKMSWSAADIIAGYTLRVLLPCSGKLFGIGSFVSPTIGISLRWTPRRGHLCAWTILPPNGSARWGLVKVTFVAAIATTPLILHPLQGVKCAQKPMVTPQCRETIVKFFDENVGIRPDTFKTRTATLKTQPMFVDDLPLSCVMLLRYIGGKSPFLFALLPKQYV